jgi:hypothetical protein
MDFLIAPVDGGFFELKEENIARMLRPIDTPSHPVVGWGTHRILVEGCEVAFSDEVAGFQVFFDCDHITEERAEQLCHEIRRSIEAVTGQRGRVFMVTGKEDD